MKRMNYPTTILTNRFGHHSDDVVNVRHLFMKQTDIRVVRWLIMSGEIQHAELLPNSGSTTAINQRRFTLTLSRSLSLSLLSDQPRIIDG